MDFSTDYLDQILDSAIEFYHLKNQQPEIMIPDKMNSPIEALNIFTNSLKQEAHRSFLVANSDHKEPLLHTVDLDSESPGIIVDIDKKISRLKTYLKDNDIELVDARNKKKALIEFRREQILGFLKAEKQATEQRLKAAERPKGIVIKYMQLLNRYIKDQTTFNKLENEYRVLLLEQARSQDPLELITKPTLLPDHVAPSKRVHTAVGLLVGTLLGFGTVLVIDKRKNILYTIKDLEEITKWQTILEVPLKNSEVLDELLVLFTSGKLLEASRSLAFIKVGAIEQKFIDKLSKNLKKSLEDRDFLIIEDFEKANNFKDIILINELGSTTYQDIIDMKKKLLLVNSNILGSIVINNFN